MLASAVFVNVVLAQFVLDTVHQGLPARLDDVFGDADGTPGFFLVTGFQEHLDPRGCTLAPLHDSNLEVDQVHLADLGVEFRQGLSKGVVEGVHRAVSLSRSQFHFIADGDLDCRQAKGGVIPGLPVGDVEALEREGLLECAGDLLHEERQRTIGRVELEPLVLQSLDLPDDFPVEGIVVPDTDAELLGLEGDVALSGEVGDDDPLVVAHLFGADVFIGLWIFSDGVHMNASFVGEGASADEGTERKRPHIRDFADVIGEIGQLPERGFRDTATVHLDLQVPDHGG